MSTGEDVAEVSALSHTTVQVPATSANLGAGFDAFGLALSCHMVVRSQDAVHGGPRVTYVEDAPDLPTGDDNLIWQSVLRFCDHYDVPVPNISLVATANIPLERGLGSSSAAIVAGLSVARAVTGAAVGDRELVTLATAIEGHPDNVAPAILGGFVACTVADSGDVIVRRVNPNPALRVVAFVPATRQGTDAARGVLPEMLSRADVIVQASRAAHVLGMFTGAWPGDQRASGDRVHEPARRAVMPASAQLLDTLRGNGVHGWLSGAGPTVAAVVPATAVLQDVVVNAAVSHGFAVKEYAYDLRGTVACPDGKCAFSGAPTCLQCPRRVLSDDTLSRLFG
jgi:homoserine kinase